MKICKNLEKLGKKFKTIVNDGDHISEQNYYNNILGDTHTLELWAAITWSSSNLY